MGLSCCGAALVDKAEDAVRCDIDPHADKVISGSMSIHAQFIVDNPGVINDFYSLDKSQLGEGAYGTVCKATQKKSNLMCAVKSISKSSAKELARFKQEIRIMKILDHPNIIKLYETFEDHRNIYLVMEFCAGGELFDRIVDKGFFVEATAAAVMQQILRGVYYMHERSVSHRDIKPENFIFVNKDPIDSPSNPLKIIDFGLSCVYKPGVPLKTKAGTPYYVSPQTLSGSYGPECDLWSVGVVMYVLLCGYPPFFASTDAEVLKKVTSGKYTFDPDDWKGISGDAKDLVRRLIELNPKVRSSARDALNHSWITDRAPNATGMPLGNDIIGKLRGFMSTSRLKKAALHVIAGHLDDSQIKQLRDIFQALDTNGNGRLTNTEVREGIMKTGISDLPPDIMTLLESVDADGSGVIDYTEFLAATLDKRQYLQEDKCWSAFRVFDRDNSGTISKEELRLVLTDGNVKEAVRPEVIAQAMSEVDQNGDGVIDFQEFMDMMRGNTGGGKQEVPVPSV